MAHDLLQRAGGLKSEPLAASRHPPGWPGAGPEGFLSAMAIVALLRTPTSPRGFVGGKELNQQLIGLHRPRAYRRQFTAFHRPVSWCT